LGPIPNPQSPIPNPQSPIISYFAKKYYIIYPKIISIILFLLKFKFLNV